MIKYYIATCILAAVINCKPPHRGLIEEAHKQLGELKSIVFGEVLTAHSNLDTLESDFRSYSQTLLNAALISIQQEDEHFKGELRMIKELASGNNISSCLDPNEDDLLSLPELYRDGARNCTDEKNNQVGQIISSSKYTVDVSINRVYQFETQLEQCGNNLLCVSPILTEIELGKIRMPQSIRGEVMAAEELVNAFELSVRSCVDGQVSRCTTEGNGIVRAIINCVEDLLQIN